MNKMIALAKREMVENRVGMVWTPAIVMGLMLLLIVTSLVLNAGDMMLGWNSDDRPIMGLGGLLDELAQNDPQVRSGMVISFLSLMSSPALLILPFVVFFIMLGGLYEERRDRSFLFWKSMPVSDTQEVLSKLIAAAVITPAIFFLVGLAAQILALLFVSLYGLAQGAAVGVLWHPGTFLLNWLHAVMVMYVWVLWALPVFAWVLFCSAYAPRAPFMYADRPDHPGRRHLQERLAGKLDRSASWRHANDEGSGRGSLEARQPGQRQHGSHDGGDFPPRFQRHDPQLRLCGFLDRTGDRRRIYRRLRVAAAE